MTPISGISIVLPVIDERDNLEFLIPELLASVQELEIEIEIVVVDDSSTDGTADLVLQIGNLDNRVQLLTRAGLERSLPESINDGISVSKFDHILWMDADGSMPAVEVPKLIREYNSRYRTNDLIVVGSRFVPGGGFKGMAASGNRSLRQARKNLRETNDSFSAMVLSRMLNRYLWLTLGRCCKDPASGFVLTDRARFRTTKLTGSYGDYCPRFLFEAHTQGSHIVEVPYICLPRKFGRSKTGEGLRELVARGFPYVLVPVRIRFGKHL